MKAVDKGFVLLEAIISLMMLATGAVFLMTAFHIAQATTLSAWTKMSALKIAEECAATELPVAGIQSRRGRTFHLTVETRPLAAAYRRACRVSWGADGDAIELEVTRFDMR